MSLDQDYTYYDILDIKPDASPQEVRDAYLRTKSAYNKDSVALYTLIASDEREDMIRKIEEAYDVLSNPDRRKQYDSNHGLLNAENDFFDSTFPPQHKKIISIDRVPPMESHTDGESLLVAPSTDFSASESRSPGPQFAPSRPQAPSAPNAEAHEDDIFGASPDAQAPDSAASAQTARRAEANEDQIAASLPYAAPAEQQTRPPLPPSRESSDALIAREVGEEVEWRGSFLKKIREARRLSIEEISAITKITRSYLFAIEDENYQKLPAAVYLRGFIVQLSKVLKLPPDKVATAYMGRYYQARPDQAR